MFAGQDLEWVYIAICICMLRGSTHYCAIHAPTSFEFILRPTLGQSDEQSDLRGSLSPTTQHRCTHVLVYIAPGSPRRSPIQLWAGPGVTYLQ